MSSPQAVLMFDSTAFHAGINAESTQRSHHAVLRRLSNIQAFTFLQMKNSDVPILFDQNRAL
jgi:hypothetical protein